MAWIWNVSHRLMLWRPISYLVHNLGKLRNLRGWGWAGGRKSFSGKLLKIRIQILVLASLFPLLGPLWCEQPPHTFLLPQTEPSLPWWAESVSRNKYLLLQIDGVTHSVTACKWKLSMEVLGYSELSVRLKADSSSENQLVHLGSSWQQ